MEMIDREKVIKGVHDARRYLEDREWVDKSVGVHIDALNDVIALLKEQDAVAPIIIKDGFSKGRDIALCGNCKRGVRIGSKTKGTKARSVDYFCGYCGRPVKWD